MYIEPVDEFFDESEHVEAMFEPSRYRSLGDRIYDIIGGAVTSLSESLKDVAVVEFDQTLETELLDIAFNNSVKSFGFESKRYLEVGDGKNPDSEDPVDRINAGDHYVLELRKWPFSLKVKYLKNDSDCYIVETSRFGRGSWLLDLLALDVQENIEIEKTLKQLKDDIVKWGLDDAIRIHSLITRL